jgi:uracil-DNA glycosylase
VRSFVGPAGRIMDWALEKAHQPPGRLRHQRHEALKWTQRGKHRIHQRPNGTEIKACGFWLEAE